MIPRLRTVLSRTCRTLTKDVSFAEGPAFDTAGRLWCVDLKAGDLVRWAPEGLTRYTSGGAPNGLAFDWRGRAWFCDAKLNAVRRFDPATEQWSTLATTLDSETPLAKPNDLAFDPVGTLVFTCPGEWNPPREAIGYVAALTPAGALMQVGTGMRFPNGLAFVDGGTALVVAETDTHSLWKGRWDAAAVRWEEPRPWAQVGGSIGPDGMAYGADGLLYVAVCGSGQVKAVDPSGRVIAAHRVRGTCPTNVAFDPSGRLGLIVTEAGPGRVVRLAKLGPGAPLFDGAQAWA
jgi:gluconolactonase